MLSITTPLPAAGGTPPSTTPRSLPGLSPACPYSPVRTSSPHAAFLTRFGTAPSHPPSTARPTNRPPRSRSTIAACAPTYKKSRNEPNPPWRRASPVMAAGPIETGVRGAQLDSSGGCLPGYLPGTRRGGWRAFKVRLLLEVAHNLQVRPRAGVPPYSVDTGSRCPYAATGYASQPGSHSSRGTGAAGGARSKHRIQQIVPT